MTIRVCEDRNRTICSRYRESLIKKDKKAKNKNKKAKSQGKKIKKG